MKLTFKFYLKDGRKEETLLLLHCKCPNTPLLKISMKHSVIVKAWNNEKQCCEVSREKFNARTNLQSKRVNAFLGMLLPRLEEYNDSNDFHCLSAESIKMSIQQIVDSIVGEEQARDEKRKLTPTQFFADYIERKRIDPHTGRYINERTKIHHRTVLHRLQKFLSDTNLTDAFSTFTSKNFDKQFTEWCYSTMNYKQNTVYATYGVLKPWLNAAQSEGIEFDDSNYKQLRGKGVDVDAIYLTEDEIKKIYLLDIPRLIAEGEIDAKSTIEQTRDLFIIACWTALRRSDISQLNKALFNINDKTITITAEKTKRPVMIPMHPMVFALWNKYNGQFPHLCDKGCTNEHLREIGRHAGIDSDVRIVENRGGKVQTLTYKKYQLIGMHTGRRSFATNMYKRKFPTIAIMKLTGHTTENNFLKYIKITPEENAVMMAEEFYKAQKPFEEDVI